MRSSIIIRNAKNSARDYIIYLITVAFSLSLVYAFNLIVYSDEIMAMSQGMNAMTAVVTGLSIIVVCVIGWLINYMSRFMLEKRSREFGTYMLLGVPPKTISAVFICENLVMGAMAFVAAIAFGTLLYQILYLIIVRLFNTVYGIPMIFSVPALLMTLLYTVLMYGMSMFKMRRHMRRLEIHDLMDMEKKNEAAANRSRKYSIVRFMIFAVIEVLSCILYMVMCRSYVWAGNYAMVLLFASMAGILMGIYGIYTTLTALVAKTALAGDVYKYGQNRLFLLRGLTSKLGSIGRMLGTLALLMTLTLSATQLGILFERFFEAQYRDGSGFEIAIASTDPGDFPALEQFFDEQCGIAYKYTYPLYVSTTDPLYDYIGLDGYVVGTPVLKASDFYKLWAALGYGPVTVSDGKYVCIGNASVYEKLTSSGAPDIVVGGETLSLQECRNEPFNTGHGYHGTGYVIVIADRLAETLPVYHSCLAINTVRPTEEADAQALYDSGLLDHTLGQTVEALTIRAESEYNKSLAVVTLAFSLYFIGLIFACTAATILAIQQLSDALRHQYRYDILSKLGMGPKKIEGLIFKQTLLYFAVPIGLPFPLSIFLSMGLNRLMLGSLVTARDFMRAMGLSLGLFLIVYFLYFMATYLGYKRRIMEKLN